MDRQVEQSAGGGRVVALDYLRGLMALSVMAYHYSVWSGVELEADSLLRKLGLYAVSIFYVLSGLSLMLVYRERITSGADLAAFLTRRFFRIAPLFWMAVTFAIILDMVRHYAAGLPFLVDTRQIVLNYTLTFGFIAPDAYLSTGAWSIGNEIVFYSVFPFLLLLAKGRDGAGVVLFALLAALIMAACFAFAVISASQPLESQWPLYINPLNQIYLFLGGASIAMLGGVPSGSRDSSITFALAGLAVLAFLVFWGVPAEDSVQLVTGWRRFVLSAACLVFVACCYRIPVLNFARRIKLLAFFGEGCYSIYLLHPLVGAVVVFALRGFHLPIWLGYGTAAVVTLAVSRVTYTLLEEPMIRLGSVVAKALRTRVATI